jgi:hypothetical protein
MALLEIGPASDEDCPTADTPVLSKVTPTCSQSCPFLVCGGTSIPESTPRNGQALPERTILLVLSTEVWGNDTESGFVRFVTVKKEPPVPDSLLRPPEPKEITPSVFPHLVCFSWELGHDIVEAS